MATPIHVEVTQDVLRTEAFIARIQDDGAGAMATFTGVTRNTFNGKKVLKLDYEGYVPMAEAKLRVDLLCIHQTCTSRICHAGRSVSNLSLMNVPSRVFSHDLQQIIAYT